MDRSSGLDGSHGEKYSRHLSSLGTVHLSENRFDAPDKIFIVTPRKQTDKSETASLFSERGLCIYVAYT